MLVILSAAGYLRFAGIATWDENQHLHPDERFLTMVETDIAPVNSLAEYFNTDTSTLNPQNRGHSFYVYGDLPIILVRYLAEWTGQTGYDQVNVLGREASAAIDLLTILLVYLIGSRLYKPIVGVLAAAFSAFAVMQIQLSHFFAVDNFANFFTTLAIFSAVLIYTNRKSKSADHPIGDQIDAPVTFDTIWGGISKRWEDVSLYILFGVALGCAMASKVNTLPLAVVLPAAALAWYVKASREEKQRWIGPILRNLIIAAGVAFLTFRIFQPYAFTGPGFFGVIPNSKWISNLTELQGQSNGNADFPPALQWARRDHLFAMKNLLLWGMGLPLGCLVWAGFLWMAWRIIRGEWTQHLILWGWTALYFGWQSLGWNPMMRYMVLVYPTLALIGAWLIVQIWDAGRKKIKEKAFKWNRVLAVVLAGFVLVGTGIWAFAFSTIYTRPMTRIAASRWIYAKIPGPINLMIQTDAGKVQQPLPYPTGYTINSNQPFQLSFQANQNGTLSEIQVFRAVDTSSADISKTLEISLYKGSDPTPITNGEITGNFLGAVDHRGTEYTIHLDPSVQLNTNDSYILSIKMSSGEGNIVLSGTSLVNESDWDDGLPLRLDGYDGYGGIYDGSQNFQMYWDDNADKLTRFESALDNGDYLIISSNRQWATTTRIPERYPLTTYYYRNILGCPPEKDILWCYQTAQPGMFKGSLGYDLVQVFQSDPKVGNLDINDQSAEESFTVYDHPKVLIFKKSAAYNALSVHTMLSSVDLTKVIHVPLKDVPANPETLMLPDFRWAQQQVGGTWADLFNMQALQNKYPAVAVVIWYLMISILGWFMVPIMRLALPGLRDKGYAFGRITGMLLLTYFSWLAGSAGIPVSRTLIAGVLIALLTVGAVAGYLQRKELKAFWRENKKYILIVEGVILAFFILDLLIRIGNPDLWHPYKGGEKPMDFSYFNAVLKSTTFPPFDPWFAGGYINYYYYGFVIVGIPVKLLGIEPSIAYNLILPTLFSLLAVGAFSIVWNVMTVTRKTPSAEINGSTRKTEFDWTPVWIGLAAAVGIALIGNLGTVRMIWQGFQKLAAPGGQIDGVSVITHWVWSIQGFFKFITGTPLSINPGDWYWIPSRTIPAPNDVEPITEFPFFTFLYADMHAHMIALPVTLLALGWAFSMIMGRGKWGEENGKFFYPSLGISLFLGALAIGTLRPTNTWDYPTYLVLGLAATIFCLGRCLRGNEPDLILKRIALNKWLLAIVLSAIVAGLSLVLYQPFSAWYGQGYNAVDLWQGTHTPFWSYLTHWGLFLFIIGAWMIHESIDWMSSTPLQSLSKFYPYKGYVIGTLIALATLIVGLMLTGVSIAWFVLLMAVWALILIFRPGEHDLKRVILFLVGSGLFLTLVVEVIVLRGDVGRMNTVFKFYLQIWTMFAISAAAALGWMLDGMAKWKQPWIKIFTTTAWILFAGAALFPMLAGTDKVNDRYVSTASHSLDGTHYMLGATYQENGKDMALEQDYYGIRWMQQNVKGSPVIVEGNTTEYRWGNRYTINTGLPSVVGWSWHQRQQRAVTPSSWVDERIQEVNNFYDTVDLPGVQAFLVKYNVKYIIVGQLEKALYSVDGIAKFATQDGRLWKKVFNYKDTTIYEILPQTGTGMVNP